MLLGEKRIHMLLFTIGFLVGLGALGKDIDKHFDRTRVKKYHEMKNYEAFDTFLTEKIKNSICEDNLGDILSFLCNTSVKYKIEAVLGDYIDEPRTFYTIQKAKP